MAKETSTKPKVAKSAGRSKATSNTQKLAIVNWLQSDVKNFNLINGNGTANYTGIVAGAKLTKKCGYVSLAEFVNRTCGSKWTYKNAEARFKAYLLNYKKVARAVSNPGGKKFCMGPDDNAIGIFSIQQKMEHMCTHFVRMDELFGGRQNVVPSHTMETLPPVSHSRTVVLGDHDSDSEEESGDEDDENFVDSDSSEEDELEDVDFERDFQEDQRSRSTLDLNALNRDNLNAECYKSAYVGVNNANNPYSAHPLFTSRATPPPSPTGVTSTSSAAPHKAATPAKKPSKKRVASLEISPELKEMCEDVVEQQSSATSSNNPPKVTQFKQEDGKGGNNKKDFSTVFQFEFTKLNFASEFALREKTISEGTKAVAIGRLIDQGHSAEKVKEFLTVVFGN